MFSPPQCPISFLSVPSQDSGRFNSHIKIVSRLDYFNADVKIVSMKTRYLQHAVETIAFGDHKMALVSGPRQAGKTTLGAMLAEGRSASRYCNWDDIEFRRLWNDSPKSIVPQAPATPRARAKTKAKTKAKAKKTSKVPLVILDEIHKDRTWKRTLKGVYDTLRFDAVPCDFFVTGSAALNVYRRGSDSMLGRYYHFRLAPFSLREMHTPQPLGPDEALAALFARSASPPPDAGETLAAMLRFGPFPEPLLAQDDAKWRLWRQGRHEMLIREDLRDIALRPDLGKIETLAAVLPRKIASPLSIASLARDIEVGHQTLQRWLGWLGELYFLFHIKPWHKSIARSIKKEGKVYLWDFSEVDDPGPRFENLVAVHLLKACNYWTDTGCGAFDLYYLRNREQQEIDFLIVRDGVPWLPVEVKTTDQTPSPNWRNFLPQLPCTRALQLTQTNTWKLYSEEDTDLLIANAAEALIYFA